MARALMLETCPHLWHRVPPRVTLGLSGYDWRGPEESRPLQLRTAPGLPAVDYDNMYLQADLPGGKSALSRGFYQTTG
jgi:hypothetical protein